MSDEMIPLSTKALLSAGLTEIQQAKDTKGKERKQHLTEAQASFEKALKAGLSTKEQVNLASLLQYKIEQVNRKGMEPKSLSKLGQFKAHIEKIQLQYYRHFFKKGDNPIARALKVIDNEGQLPEQAEKYLQGAWSELIFKEPGSELKNFKDHVELMKGWEDLIADKKIPKVIQKAMAEQLSRYVSLKNSLLNMQAFEKSGEQYSLKGLGVDDLVAFYKTVHADKSNNAFMQARIDAAKEKLKNASQEVPLEAIKILADESWKQNETVIRDFASRYQDVEPLKGKIDEFLDSPVSGTAHDIVSREVTKLTHYPDYLKYDPSPVLKSISENQDVKDWLADESHAYQANKLADALLPRLKAYLGVEGDLSAVKKLLDRLGPFAEKIKAPFSEAVKRQESNIVALSQVVEEIGDEKTRLSIKTRHALLEQLGDIERTLDNFSSLHADKLKSVREKIAALKTTFQNEIELLSGPTALKDLYADAIHEDQEVKLLNTEEAAIYRKWVNEHVQLLEHSSISKEVQQAIRDKYQTSFNVATKGIVISPEFQLERFASKLFAEGNPTKQKMAVHSKAFDRLLALKRGQLKQGEPKEVAEATLRVKELEALAGQHGKQLSRPRRDMFA